jgi:hypothetical protein
MNTSQRLKALEADYERLLRQWQSLMDKTTDPHAQHRLHIIGNRMHSMFEEMRDEILTGGKR